MHVIFQPIGIIRSPFTVLEEMPIQPSGETAAFGSVEVFPEFADGLRDLEGFSHVILIYHLHRSGPARLLVTPFLDDQPHGLFATRSPARPNPIGLSVVELLRVEGRTLHLSRLDVLDGTPLLDIKPYVPDFDAPPAVRFGWLEQARARARSTRSDDRFSRP